VRLPISPYPHLGCKNTVFLDYEDNFLEIIWAISIIAFGGICSAFFGFGIFYINMPSGIYIKNTSLRMPQPFYICFSWQLSWCYANLKCKFIFYFKFCVQGQDSMQTKK
jgi:hypothetical protein